MTNEELLDRFNRFLPPTGVLLGMRVLEVDAAQGRVRMSFAARPEFCNPNGTVQGGIVAAMLDDAAAFAAIVKSGERIFVPTLEFKTSFFGPARAGTLFAEGRCLKLGRTIAYMESDLFTEDGKHIARMSVTAAPRRIEGDPNLVARTEEPPAA